MLRIATIGTSPITDNLIEVLNASSEARFVGTLSRDAERAAEEENAYLEGRKRGGRGSSS